MLAVSMLFSAQRTPGPAVSSRLPADSTQPAPAPEPDFQVGSTDVLLPGQPIQIDLGVRGQADLPSYVSGSSGWEASWGGAIWPIRVESLPGTSVAAMPARSDDLWIPPAALAKGIQHFPLAEPGPRVPAHYPPPAISPGTGRIIHIEDDDRTPPAVPEPGSIGILLTGSLLALRRRFCGPCI